jgi:hypothetical protein
VTGGEDPVMYTPGRARPGGLPTPDDAPVTAEHTTYQAVTHLAYDWAPVVDERLTAIEAETYDLADQVRGLGHRVTVALCTTIAALGVLVAAAVIGR